MAHPSLHHGLQTPNTDPAAIASYRLLKGYKESEIFLRMASLSEIFLYLSHFIYSYSPSDIS